MSESSRWQKLKRGELHAEALKREIPEFMKVPDNNASEYTEKFNLEHKSWVVWISRVHLVRDLALLNTKDIPLDRKNRPWKPQFPICDSQTYWSSGGIANQVASLSAHHVSLIESRQPYRGGNTPPRPHPLISLQWLSNTDKHTAIQPIVSSMVGMTFGIETSGDCSVLTPAYFPDLLTAH